LESLERCESHLQKRAEVVQVQRLLHPLRHQLRNGATSNATAVADEVSVLLSLYTSDCLLHNGTVLCEILLCIVMVCSASNSSSSTVLIMVVAVSGAATASMVPLETDVCKR
jgi:hypothetical protein